MSYRTASRRVCIQQAQVFKRRVARIRYHVTEPNPALEYSNSHCAAHSEEDDLLGEYGTCAGHGFDVREKMKRLSLQWIKRAPRPYSKERW